jgi:addiction module HigA family antidote
MRSHPLPTHRPTHPGEILEEEFRKELGLTQQALANRLGIMRTRYAEIANGKRAVTVDTALRLERVFGTSAQMWLNLQAAVDLWDAMHAADYEKVKKLKPIKREAVPA